MIRLLSWVVLVLVALGASAALPRSGRAQTIRVFYFAPTATMNGAFGAANTSGATRREGDGNVVPVLPGYRFIEVTAANRTAFNGICPTNLRQTYDNLMDPSTALRRKMSMILGISGNKVSQLVFLMVDDRSGLSGADSSGIFCIAHGMIWPCASNWQNSGATTYSGRVRFGERAAAQTAAVPSGGGFPRWEGVVLHEVSHTQYLPDPTGVNKWGPNGIGISYGGDKGHWFTELQADEQQAMDEGMASFWGLAHNPVQATEIIDFLNQNDEKFLLGSHSFLTGTPEMWNAPHTTEYEGPASGAKFKNGNAITLVTPGLQPGSRYALRRYKWLNVPGKYVLYNEQMSESYFLLFQRYGFASQDTAYTKLLGAASVLSIPNQRFRYPAHVANILANSMEAYARAHPSEPQLVSSMFALGLYDLLGHFGRSDADLLREFTINAATYTPTPVPRAIAEYMRRRAAVKALVCPSLSGNGTCAEQGAAINVQAAVEAMRNYFRNPATILR